MKTDCRAGAPPAAFRCSVYKLHPSLRSSGIRTPSRGRRSARPTNHPRAFTLTELLVCLTVVAVLSGIGWPVYQRVVQGSRASACASNLRQIGAALNLYLGEHNMVMPALKAGRTKTSDDVPVIDNTLNAYAPNAKVFACPSDAAGLAAKSGTSYFWNVALSGQSVTSLNFFRKTDRTVIPILSDKDTFHPYTETKVNILYADGHADKDITFVTAKP